MRLAVFCSILIALSALAGCRPAAAPVSVSERPVAINDRRTTNAPLPPSKPFSEMSWTTASDKVQKMSDLTGKAVILDFWATYCEPCKREIPHLNSLIAKYGKDNLHIVGLNVGGDEDKPKIPAFVAATKVEYEIAFPEDALADFIFSERSDIPQTAVFDRKGRMVQKLVGFSDQIQKDLDAAVEIAVNLQ
ncbi:MAG: TlpA disulfide reductase family protein [Pyrinomonadaceae bacterium]